MISKFKFIPFLFLFTIISSTLMISCGDDKVEEEEQNKITCPGFTLLDVDVILNNKKLALLNSILNIDKIPNIDIYTFRISAIGESCLKSETIDINLYRDPTKLLNGTYTISEPLDIKAGLTTVSYIVQQFSPINQTFSVLKSGTVKIKENSPKNFTIELNGKSENNEDISMTFTHTFE